jgi:hypothetical protein
MFREGTARYWVRSSGRRYGPRPFLTCRQLNRLRIGAINRDLPAAARCRRIKPDKAIGRVNWANLKRTTQNPLFKGLRHAIQKAAKLTVRAEMRFSIFVQAEILSRLSFPHRKLPLSRRGICFQQRFQRSCDRIERRVRYNPGRKSIHREPGCPNFSPTRLVSTNISANCCGVKAALPCLSISRLPFHFVRIRSGRFVGRSIALDTISRQLPCRLKTWRNLGSI